MKKTTISGLNPAIKIPTLSPGVYMVKSHLHNKLLDSLFIKVNPNHTSHEIKCAKPK